MLVTQHQRVVLEQHMLKQGYYRSIDKGYQLETIGWTLQQQRDPDQKHHPRVSTTKVCLSQLPDFRG